MMGQISTVAVLLISKSAQDASLFREQFQHTGDARFVMTVVTSIEAALPILRNQPIHAILIDITFFEDAAVNNAQRIQNSGSHASIIILADRYDSSLASKIGQIGAHDFLIKDEFTPSLLVRAVEGAIERKHYQDALYDAERRYKRLFENASDAILIVELVGGRILDVNKKAAKLLGYKQEEMLGLHITEIEQVSDKSAQQALHHALASSKQIIYETQYKDRKGYLIHVEVSTSITTFGAARCLLHVVRDITERKESENILRSSEEKFRAIFNESLDIILILDLQQERILEANPAASRLLGYEPHDLIGESFSRFCDKHQIPEIVERIRSEGTVFEGLTLTKSDGSILQAELNASLIWWGSREAALLMLRDLGDRMRLEEARLRNEQMRQELENEKEIIKGKIEFISMVPHQFRTPLSVIISSSDILQRYRERLSPEQHSHHVGKITKQAHHLNQMIDDLMAFGRSLSGKLECKPQAINLDDICDTLLLQDAAQRDPHHHYHYTNHTGYSTVYLDSRLLSHILDNLLTNAAKYSPTGSAIHLNVVEEEDHLAFRISDQGIGIPEHEIDSLFEPFKRASNTGSIPGTGLGLTIVRESVQAHGGFVRVESQENAGTVFVVYLPILKNGKLAHR